MTTGEAERFRRNCGARAAAALGVGNSRGSAEFDLLEKLSGDSQSVEALDPLGACPGHA